MTKPKKTREKIYLDRIPELFDARITRDSTGDTDHVELIFGNRKRTATEKPRVTRAIVGWCFCVLLDSEGNVRGVSQG